MTTWEARAFLNALDDINNRVDEFNEQAIKHCFYVARPDVVVGLEEMADALQLTRKYEPYNNNLTVSVEYKGRTYKDIYFNHMEGKTE